MTAWEAAQAARIASLEEEVLLKEEALRAQVEELDGVRRALRAEEVAKRQLVTSEQLAKAQHKKVAGEARELELLVENLRRELDAAGLETTAERQGKRHLAEQAETLRQELAEATSALAAQAVQLQQAQEQAEAAEEGRRVASTEAERLRRESDATVVQARASSEEAVREGERKLAETKVQLMSLQQLAQEQGTKLVELGDQARRDTLELSARASRIAALSEMLEHTQADKQAAAEQLVGASREAWEVELQQRLLKEQAEAVEHRLTFVQGELEAKSERLRRAEEVCPLSPSSPASLTSSQCQLQSVSHSALSTSQRQATTSQFHVG